MKRAIIVHGMPSRQQFSQPGYDITKRHWFPWLKKELEAAGIETHTPQMPEPYDPDYDKWREVFERLPIDKETLLIGHSCGAGFLLRWLSEHTDVRIAKLALVAPWVDIDGRTAPKMFTGYSADLSLTERAQMALFSSDDDDTEELETFKLLKSQYPDMKVFEFNNRGHFTGPQNLEFQELRDYLL